MPEWLLLSVLKWKTLNVVKKRLLFVLSLDVNPLTIIKSFWAFVVAFSWFFHPMPCNWFLWTRCWWKRCNFWMLFKVKREKKRVEVWKQGGGGGEEKNGFCFTWKLVFGQFHQWRQRKDCCLIDYLLTTMSKSQALQGGILVTGLQPVAWLSSNISHFLFKLQIFCCFSWERGAVSVVVRLVISLPENHVKTRLV